jgi:PAS domain-containing protein
MLLLGRRAASRIQQRLAESHRRLEALLEEMPFGVTLFEVAAAKVVFANREAKRILQSDVVGTGPFYRFDDVPSPPLHEDGTAYKPDELPLTLSTSFR